MKPIQRTLSIVAVLGASWIAAPAGATPIYAPGSSSYYPGVYCQHFWTPFSAPRVCVETYVGGAGAGEQFTGSPIGQSYYINNSGGTAGSAGVGRGGINGSASAIADFGTVRLKAYAESGDFDTPSDKSSEQGSVTSYAGVFFQDQGTVVGPAGVSPGTPVVARVTLLAEGAFMSVIPGTPFSTVGEGRETFYLGAMSGATLVPTQHVSIFHGHPRELRTFDITLSVGEMLSVAMRLEAFAHTGNDQFNAILLSSADLGNTGRFTLDFQTPGYSFDALSGHDYSSASDSDSNSGSGSDDPAGPIFVPEPSAWVFLGLGFAIVWLRARRAARSRERPCTPQ